MLEAQFSEQLPLVTIIDAFPSVAQAMNLRATLQADKALQDATDAWQTGPERPFESLSAELLETTAFSPAFAPPNPPPKAPRVYEMRVYQTHTQKELRGLVERFAEAEAKILKRSGSDPMMFGITAFGPDKPNLTWMMAFDDLAARDRFTAAFNADPEWVALRKQSLERWGQIPSYRHLTLYRSAGTRRSCSGLSPSRGPPLAPWRPAGSHSARKAIDGCTDVARRAGTMLAAMTTRASRPMTADQRRGSVAAMAGAPWRRRWPA